MPTEDAKADKVIRPTVSQSPPQQPNTTFSSPEAVQAEVRTHLLDPSSAKFDEMFTLGKVACVTVAAKSGGKEHFIYVTVLNQSHLADQTEWNQTCRRKRVSKSP
jgi:hypothetical protein